MLRLPGTELRLCDWTTRRTVLRLGGLGMLSLAGGMPNGHPAVAASNSRRATAKHVVFFSLYGGPAHQDMFDLKPEAPADIRGEFSAIETSAPGVWISEYLPRLAKLAHRYTLIRSMTHSDNGHGSALYTLVTGWPHPQPNSGPDPSPTDYPAYGTLMSSVQPPRAAVPPYVMVGGVMASGAGQNGGLLGPSRSPLVIDRNADSPNFEVPGFSLPPDLPEIRLSRRRGLLDQVNAWTWGNDEPEPDQAVFGLLASKGTTALVGSKPGDVSPFGALDMAGNVLEWCADWAEAYPSIGAEKDTVVMDPLGPSQGTKRIMRGACWVYSGPVLRASERLYTLPNLKRFYAGFRMAVGTETLW